MVERDFPWLRLYLPMQGVLVQSLAFGKPRSQAQQPKKKKKKKDKLHGFLF